MKCESGKTRKALEKDCSRQLEHMQTPIGKGQDLRKIELLLWHATPVANALLIPSRN